MITFFEWVVIGYLEDLVSYKNDSPEGSQWRRCMVKFTGVSAGWDPADDCYISFDIANITSGDLDDTWTDADFLNCEGEISTFLNAYKPFMTGLMKVSEFRWYRREFNPPGDPKPFADSGPPVRVQAASIAGTGASPNYPPQVAMSVTERTPFPRHWGRFYLPGLAGFNLDATTRQFGSSIMTAVSAAADTMYSNLGDDEFHLVVPITSVNNQPVRGLIGVSEIQLDSIPDVVRRRRPKTPLTRTRLALS